MNRRVVYPGSFDPMTVGHVDIIQRLHQTFDEVVVLISESSQKTALFTTQERKNLIEQSLPSLKRVKVVIYDGLTTDYMKRENISLIVRGLRAVSDFEYEMGMSNFNKKLFPEMETLLVFAKPEFDFISSRGVKEVARHGGDLQGLVPPPVIKALQNKMSK